MRPLRTNELTVQAVVDAMSANIAIVAQDGVILLVNTAWERFSRENGGATSKTSVGTNYFDACSRAEQEGTKEALDVARALRLALSSDVVESMPVEYPCHSPLENRWFSVLCTPLRIEGRRCALVVHENITLRHELSERVSTLTSGMSQVDRLAILGEWTGAVGHEIKNPLTVIQARASLLRRHVLESADPPDGWILENCDVLLRMCQRIDSIVEGVMALARPSNGPKFETASLKSIIADAVFFVEPRLHARKITYIAPELDKNLTIECQSVQMTEVILNLVSNACDAVEATRRPAERWIKISVQTEQDQIRLIVENGGPPIPANARDRILGDRPFSLKYGTKRSSLGLGLLISRRFLLNHHGRIELDRQAPHPRFVITLPRCQNCRTAKEVA